MVTQGIPTETDFGLNTRNHPLTGILASMYGEAGVGPALERYGTLASELGKKRAGEEIRFYSAPGRTELGGNHTDHNHGRVLCAAVRLDAVAAVSPRNDGIVNIVSKGYSRPVKIELRSLEARAEESGTTQALVRGVAHGLSDRLAKTSGTSLKGFDAVIQSDVLQGSGLSSSAAIEVLLGTIMADLAGIQASPVEIAKIGQYAENIYFGKPSGLMDQTACAAGGIAFIDFADPANPVLEKIEYDFGRVGYALVVVDTGGSHADLTADYASIPAEMKAAAAVFDAASMRDVDTCLIIARAKEIREAAGDRAFLRAFHFLGENERVARMAAALREQRLSDYFSCVRESGDSSWRFLQNLSSPQVPREQGLCVALALSESMGPDAAGKKIVSRVHGGGFAGTIQAYVPSSLLGDYTSLMESCFGAGHVIPIDVRIPGAIRVF